ncbi:FUSC family protein [Miniphocaeibacter massiliensis]|uniref:FUSC family protein n=1 Tax=Miniphocaeibacter massiliensis TaxID=2041841 RepID=UPI0013ECE02F|nr:aromatic acid exporter family protein [Miniphocaeibacter massiliensis]
MNNFLHFLKKTFGPRTLKTAVATTLSIYVAHLLGMNNPILAGISAVVSMTSSVFDSYKISVNRILSTIIGAIIAIVFQYFGIKSMIAMFFGIILIINICNYFNWNKSTPLSCIVFIIIMLYQPRLSDDPSYYMYAFYRVTDTTVGLLIGFFINYFIYPPNRHQFLLSTYTKSLKEFENSFKLLLANSKNIKLGNLIDDINEINTELKSIKNDKKLFKNKNFKISDISKINNDFYTAFGLITQLSENGQIPNISNENLKLIKNYFGSSSAIISTNIDKEYELAFNYYLDELLETFFRLKENIKIFEKNIEKI